MTDLAAVLSTLVLGQTVIMAEMGSSWGPPVFTWGKPKVEPPFVYDIFNIRYSSQNHALVTFNQIAIEQKSFIWSGFFTRVNLFYSDVYK
jgi:hypothetical protein